MNEENQFPNNESPNSDNQPNNDTGGNQLGNSNQGEYWSSNQNQQVNLNQYQNQFNNESTLGSQGQQGNQTRSHNPNPKKSNKLMISIVSIIIALLVIGGGAFAFFNMTKSPKDKLLLAEFNSMSQLQKVFESRYKPELDFAKKAETTPTEFTYDIGVSVDGEFYGNDEQMIAEILNNSLLSLNIQMDPNKQVMKADLGANVNGIEIDKFSGYITTEEFMLGLPFTDDILQLKGKDFGNFMRILDPYYEGMEELDLSDWMGRNAYSEETLKYLKDEYLLLLVNSLPNESFTEASEEIDVFGEKVKASKITMSITSTQLKEILVSVLEKAKDDTKLEKIIFSSPGAVESFELESGMSWSEALDVALTELKGTEFPTEAGFNYTVWVKSDTVVKSELLIDEFTIVGTRQFSQDSLKWDYTIGNGDTDVYFKGVLTSNNGEFNDTITLMDENDTGFSYEGTEKLNGGDREFERYFSFNDGYDEYGFYWNGESSYQGDSMNAEHRFGVSIDELAIEVSLDETGKVIKNVEIPSDNFVNIGEMSEEELYNYIEGDLMNQAQSWAMGLIFQLGIF